MIFQLIYTSAVASTVAHSEIIKIAQHASDKNKNLEVTGMMIYHQGSILQVLEGSKATVEALFEKIKKDPRHTQVLQLIARETQSREFSDWAMGFKTLPDKLDDPALSNLSAKNYKNILPENTSTVVTAISKSFARINQIC